MNTNRLTILAILVAVVLVTVYASIFVVNERQQAPTPHHELINGIQHARADRLRMNHDQQVQVRRQRGFLVGSESGSGRIVHLQHRRGSRRRW